MPSIVQSSRMQTNLHNFKKRDNSALSLNKRIGFASTPNLTCNTSRVHTERKIHLKKENIFKENPEENKNEISNVNTNDVTKTSSGILKNKSSLPPSSEV